MRSLICVKFKLFTKDNPSLPIIFPGNIIGNDGLSFVNNLNFKEIKDLKNYKISSLKFFEDDILEIRNLKK